MNVVYTDIEGVLILEPKIYRDNRGFFTEVYNWSNYPKIIRSIPDLQDNVAKSTHGVIRGLHYQKDPYPQAKLVTCLYGSIYDVAVDIRKDSPTYGKWVGTYLRGDNPTQFFIPEGFAHGYSVLSDLAVVTYKCNQLYHPESEDGIYPLDDDLDIDWRLPARDIILSDKDKSAQLFNDLN